MAVKYRLYRSGGSAAGFAPDWMRAADAATERETWKRERQDAGGGSPGRIPLCGDSGATPCSGLLQQERKALEGPGREELFEGTRRVCGGVRLPRSGFPG